MKQFSHIISRLFYEPLLITHARHAAIVKIVEAAIASGNWAKGRVHGDNPDLDGTDGPEPDPESEFQIAGASCIIPVHGVITRHASDIPASSCGCGLDKVSDMIKVALADDAIENLVFDFRTPGGGVTGVSETGSWIAAIQRKTTVAYTDSECCSAGLWLAAQCQQFYCAPSASVGSIGVWTAYGDISRQLANEGVNIQAISAGKHKLLGAYWKPLTDEEKKMLQADVDRIFVQFKEAVNSRREIDPKWMEGQIFDGQQACEIGLCDGLVDDIGELIDDGEGN
jgi:protease-4